MLEWCVIGSGPAGVAAAQALVARGLPVTMLDAGLALEPDRRALLDRLSARTPDEWAAEDLARLTEGLSPGLGGIPLKRCFGSDFAYRETERFAKLESHGVELTWSLAKGGFSNVWGAAVLPFARDDFADWPISLDELAPYYRAVVGFMDLAGADDDLARVLPLYAERLQALRPSRQATAFLSDLAAHREELGRAGYTFGQGRLAVRAEPLAGRPGCVYCGLCLHGCPYDLIYRSANSVEALAAGGLLSYRPDVVVRRLEERPDRVVVHGARRSTDEPCRVEARRVFLACGVIPSTVILLESLDALDRPVVMQDSQYLLLPALRRRGVPGVADEPLHTLTQVCLELRDPAVAPRGVHLSVYTHNRLFAEVLRRAMGPAARLAPALYHALLGRLLVFGGYLHSADSPAIELTLTGPVAARRVVLRAVDNPRSAPTLRQVLGSLRRHQRDFGLRFLWPLVRAGQPGRGYHSGGTFPMRAEPGPFEADTMARPTGFRRVHVVDATCFPDIPAPNLTLSVMANAFRVADQVAVEGAETAP